MNKHRITLFVFALNCFFYVGAVNKTYTCRVVDFGHDLGDGTYRDKANSPQTTYKIDVDGDGNTADDCIAFWEFSLTQPINSQSYKYLKSATNSRFFGGITAFYDATGKFISEGMLNANHELRDDNNFMDIQGSSVKHRNNAFWFWKKEDFLNGGNTNPVSFDAKSTITVHISRFWSGIEGGRWVVQEGSQFYISEKTFGSNGTASGLRLSHTLYPTMTRWALYNPVEPWDVRFNATTAVYENHNFNDVSSVGFYVYRDNLVVGNTQIKWHAFEVVANVTREEKPSFNATMTQVPASGEISSPFYISTKEVDYALWRKAYNWAVSNQYCLSLGIPGYVFDRDGDVGSMDVANFTHNVNEPVTDISWHDAALWCNALSEMEGLEPCYYSDAAKTKVLREIKNRIDSTKYAQKYSVYVDYTKNGYRLPTMSEWNAASTGSTINESNAWIGANSGGTTKTTATKTANNLGIYDMFGNVWEYCWDTNMAGDYYNPATQNSHTVLGGGFNYPTPTTVPIKKWGDIPSKGNPNIGFRIVRADAGATPPTTQNSGSVPTWTIVEGEKILPSIAPEKIQSLVQTAKISGSKTYKTSGDPLYENDNVGFTRTDDAVITITPFHMAKYETSYAMWREIYNWAEINGYTFDDDAAMGAQNYRVGELTHQANEPATETNWNDIMLWCNALSEYEGKTPVYFADDAKTIVIKKGLQWRIDMEQRYVDYPTYTNNAIKARFENDGYRLPTYAEWEAAYRAGNETKNLSFPSSIGTSWINTNSNDSIHSVYAPGDQPNSYGIYHLYGNISEYTMGARLLDYYRYHNPKDDSDEFMFGIDTRGGCFVSEARKAAESESESYKNRASAPRHFIGFRVVRCDAGRHNGYEPPIDIKVPVDISKYNDNSGQTFHNNNKRTGEFLKTGVPSPKIQTKWTYTTGGKVQSSPVVINDTLYVGSDDAKVYAINAKTGALIWSYTTGGAIETSSPTIYQGKLFIGSKDTYLYCLNAKTGTLIWKKKGYTTAYVKSSPMVAYNTVFATFHGEFNATSTIGYDINTGAEVWRYRDSRCNEGSISSDETTMFFPTKDNVCAGTDIATEIKKWEYIGVHSAASMPIVNGNSVLYVAEHFARLQNKTTGLPIWTRTVGQNTDGKPWSTPAIGTVNNSGTTSQSIFWSTLKLKAGKALLMSLNPADGSINWQKEYDLSFKSSPALANNMIYVGNDDSYLYAVNAVNGDLIWSFKTGDIVMSSPWIENNVVYVGSNDANVYAVEEDTTTAIMDPTTKRFVVYPSPTSNYLTINCDYKIHKVRITNLLGQSYNFGIDYELNKVDVSSLPSGVYSIEVFSNTQLIGKSSFIRK
ncbi:MAG: SUMF1/EgtB/PvdO family nonheme iron enzyme [Bacteroidales bacterium]|nr:SUMF1/EgtB/PvdO family nonheme iron enzyme [Bacteroidales bacterium]